MYELEWNAAKTHGSAKLVWQFEYPVRLATGGDAANATTAARDAIARFAQERAALAPPAPARRLASAPYATARNANLEDVFEHDAMTFDGGSVKRLSNGNYLVGLTAVVASRAWNPASAMLVFEVDDAANVVAMMTIPHPIQTKDVADGGYRTLPWGSISGESTQDPFAS